MHKLLFLFSSLFFLTAVFDTGAVAQQKVQRLKRSTKDVAFEKVWNVLASDTNVVDGPYALYYKGHSVERGLYRQGKRVGVWEFEGQTRKVELRYNYTTGQPTYIVPRKGFKYDQKNWPCLFLGSPLVPHIFLLTRVYYPQSEGGRIGGGKVIVTLEVDDQGHMTGYHIKQSTCEAFTAIVSAACEQIPRTEWRWIPASKDGKFVEGEYDVVIFFDN